MRFVALLALCAVLSACTIKIKTNVQEGVAEPEIFTLQEEVLPLEEK